MIQLEPDFPAPWDSSEEGDVMPRIKGRTLGKTTVLKLTVKQAEEAREFGTIKKTTGGYQSTFQDVVLAINIIDGRPVTQVYAVTLEKLKSYAGRTDTGSYQDWCRAVLTANSIDC
jgi:hypothetical protein